MLHLPPSVRIFFCVMPVDIRRSFDTLAEMVREFLGEDPMSGHLFVFRNREESKLKVLYWDRDGYAIWYKRLEKGTFVLPSRAGAPLEIDTTSFSMLLHGIDSGAVKKQKRYTRSTDPKRPVSGVSV